MSESAVCPACKSNLYAVVKVYIGNDETGALAMQDLSNSEVLVQCENDDCKINRVGDHDTVPVELDEFTDQVVEYLARAGAAVQSLTDKFAEPPITARDRAWYEEYRKFVLLRQSDRLAAMGYDKDNPKRPESPDVSL